MNCTNKINSLRYCMAEAIQCPSSVWYPVYLFVERLTESHIWNIIKSPVLDEMKERIENE